MPKLDHIPGRTHMPSLYAMMQNYLYSHGKYAMPHFSCTLLQRPLTTLSQSVTHAYAFGVRVPPRGQCGIKNLDSRSNSTAVCQIFLGESWE